MKKYADRKRTELQLDIGDMVFIKLQALRKNQKLGMRYFGPFPIIEKIGFVAYHLQLPSTAKIHSVFHFSLLKKMCWGR